MCVHNNRWTSVLAIASLLSALAGCGKPNTPTAESPATRPAPTAAAQDPPPAFKVGDYIRPGEIWRWRQMGVAFCYRPRPEEKNCESMEFTTQVTPGEAVVSLWMYAEPGQRSLKVHTQVVERVREEGNCYTYSAQSLERTELYVPAMDRPELRPEDVPVNAREREEAFRELLRANAATLGKQTCRRFRVTALDDKGTPVPVLEVHRFIDGIKQPDERLVNVELFTDAAWARQNLRLRAPK